MVLSENLVERENSTELEGPDRKRRRKVLSCNDCRRRKVQCDRATPACTRCAKAGKATSCTYEDDASVPANGSINGSHLANAGYSTRPTPPQGSVTISRDVWDDLVSRLLQQERTIERLRTRGLGLQAGDQSRVVEPDVEVSNGLTYNKPNASKETMLFRGHGFRTQYYGPTDARSTLSHIPEALGFFRESISRSPALVRSRRAMESLRDLKKIVEKSEESAMKKEPLDCVPSRPRSDVMVNLYLENVDTTFGIIHVPSFREEYEAFWQDPSSARPAFVVVLVLLIACVECVVDESPRLFIADSPLARERSAKTVEVCEDWVAKQSQKHMSLEYFQILCLLLLVKQSSSIKMKRRWTEAGTLVRFAVSAGLNRPTDLLLKRTSPFATEMRKRLWSFVVEMDLQASLDRGMPCTCVQYISDCGLPANITDEEMDEAMTEAPLSKPTTEITKMTYLCVSAQSRSLRAELTTLLNQPDHHLPYEDILSYTQQIERHLRGLPVLNGDTGADVPQTNSFGQSIILLRIQLQQYLLVLHASAARQASTDIASSFSKSAFLTVSRSIIKQLSELASNGQMFLLLLRQDIIRIFVSTGSLAAWPLKASTHATEPDDSEQEARAWLDLAEKALALFEERLMRSGNLQWSFSFAIYDLLRRKASSSEVPKGAASGCDRIYRLIKHITDHQEPNFAMQVATHQEATQSASVVKHVPATSSNTEGCGHSTMAGTGGQASADPMLNNNIAYASNTTDLVEWNFDDWMLYNDVFWQQNLTMPETAIPSSFSI